MGQKGKSGKSAAPPKVTAAQLAASREAEQREQEDQTAEKKRASRKEARASRQQCLAGTWLFPQAMPSVA